jgi:hypothetical protein
VEIEQHVAWATLQDPIVRTVADYAENCRVFAPTPEAEWKPGYVYYKVLRAVVLSPDICDAQVVIPAGYRKIIAVGDHGKVIAVMPREPGGRTIADSYYIELAEGLELVQPGGKVVKLERQQTGGYVFEEPDVAGPVTAPASDKKPGRRKKAGEG